MERPLRPGAQRQVVLVTDGLIGFEAELVAAVTRSLPAASRLHTVGVGSSVLDKQPAQEHHRVVGTLDFPGREVRSEVVSGGRAGIRALTHQNRYRINIV